MFFYKLKYDEKYPNAWYNDKVDIFLSIKCPVYDGHQRAKRNRDQNLSIEIKKPKMGDFVTTVFSDWLITDRVAEIFEKNKLTGYNLRPVDICNYKFDFSLWELNVTGTAGKAHPDSGIFIEEYCGYCNNIKFSPIKKGTGIIINENTWDGSDIFTIEEFWKFIFVTDKVKEIIEQNKFKGVLFIKPNEL